MSVVVIKGMKFPFATRSLLFARLGDHLFVTIAVLWVPRAALGKVGPQAAAAAA